MTDAGRWHVGCPLSEQRMNLSTPHYPETTMTNLVRHTPSLRRTGTDLDRLFDSFFGTTTRTEGWSPRVDLSEREAGYVLALDLPGLAKEDVTITFEDGLLTVAGERTRPETEGVTYYRHERIFGTFTRTFRFRSDINAEGITATFEHGVLTIEIPKSEAAQPRTIKIS